MRNNDIFWNERGDLIIFQVTPTEIKGYLFDGFSLFLFFFFTVS